MEVYPEPLGKPLFLFGQNRTLCPVVEFILHFMCISAPRGLRVRPFVDAVGRQFYAYFVCNNRRILLFII